METQFRALHADMVKRIKKLLDLEALTREHRQRLLYIWNRCDDAITIEDIRSIINMENYYFNDARAKNMS